MVKQRMDLLELVRKQAEDADPSTGSGQALDFLREAMGMLVQAIMEAEVAAQIGAEHGERSPARLTQRNGYRPRPWDTRVGTLDLHIPKVREGQLLPLAARAAPAQRASLARGGAAGLRRGRLHPEGGRAGEVTGLRRHLQEPGLPHLSGAGCDRGVVPGPSAGRRAVPLSLAGRPHAEGARGRTHRQRERRGGHRGQRRGASSRIVPPPGVSSGRCWPSSTTSGRSAGVISPRRSWT